jgi:hypothetical protein
MQAERYEQAIAEYQAAYDLSGNAEYLFDIAEAHRRKGDKKQALVEFQRYRHEAPAGPRAGDAVEKIATLEREIAEEARKPARDDQGGPPDDVRPDITAPPEIPPEKKTKTGVDWGWLVVGTAVIATGIVTDVVPDSGSNGELDGLDLLPIGLYGLGGYFMYEGVF